LSHSTAFSPEAGLKISATVEVVVGVGIVVELVTRLDSVALEDVADPPHAVRNKKTTGTNRFNMMRRSLAVY
jgi:hypothetical protein